ncbi:MAG: hypothetical protein WKF97_08320 [Chitinophagaceae bacterium]
MPTSNIMEELYELEAYADGLKELGPENKEKATGKPDTIKMQVRKGMAGRKN